MVLHNPRKANGNLEGTEMTGEEASEGPFDQPFSHSLELCDLAHSRRL